MDKLLVVEYSRRTNDKIESLIFIFDGGTLSSNEISQIRLEDDELIEFKFFSKENMPEEMTGTLERRILAAWGQVEKEGGLYLERQK